MGATVQFVLQEKKRILARGEKASVRCNINVTAGRKPQTSAGRGKGALLSRAHRFHKRRIVLRVVSYRVLRPSTPGPRNDERREGRGVRQGARVLVLTSVT
ncbi:hypothetical protein NDU88_010542 [Pleurodeles waltl]|uniref:Uncharacterized protein n=1 Tax=Pleurodeles waltl TaxID=8319 RepID=A0AAV7S0Y7_PLEWA|nr:hypothetical protein NDU88_010542 [Pleurodeles waltl]